MNQHEQLRPIEKVTLGTPDFSTQDAELAQSEIQRIFQERTHMLGSISSYLNHAQNERITQKIEREQQVLLSYVERDARVVEAKKKSVTVLDEAFFTQKRIDPSHF